jgi:hypothetical protein
MYLIVLKLFVLLYAVQHLVVGLDAHEFSFAEYDEYEKR